ncbi:hypothetical protein AF335_01885 [Streptomyces eurocidicus]|uniref:Uncharacterized protein n=1 Tax=Streptomyces eurocidicus TaxID=66423 RepID=A0A2N8P2B5_STREU|nr:hypothetical protein [Streptomyces eurocidicus]MBB5121152.1 hypothetical protein [Streptomyces eurocidicus]MBF6054166.1 hypothetical protein [Streptomyces eurocidicus]PNE35158.1 hypothetical protein AF335_01885 [Streptomyces eurocidicus]
MTDPAPHDPAAVALELEKLRGAVEVGFARVDGSLALLVQRSDQTDAHLADHEARLDDLERARWPLPALATVTAVAGLLLSLWQATTTH